MCRLSRSQRHHDQKSLLIVFIQKNFYAFMSNQTFQHHRYHRRVQQTSHNFRKEMKNRFSNTLRTLRVFNHTFRSRQRFRNLTNFH